MTIHFPRVGERFQDRYEITEILGAGGMSRVYGAVQDGLERKVAIKLLAPAGAENLTHSQFDKIAARFEREAKLISGFRSSHTVVMYDYGRSEDYLFMILEHVDGLNLHELVEQTGPLPAERVARIMRQALASLAEAHEMGILHRDIKPQNIMVYEHLGNPDHTKLLDFGIAKAIGETGKDQRKLTEERTIVGTPSYMSPEQILGNELTPASDIYSLGLVAYELLFGIVAVEADSAVSTMARHLAPTPIEIPDDGRMPVEFLAILRKMIAKDVGQRYAGATDVLEDLNGWDGGDRSLTLPRITSQTARTDTLDGEPPVVPHPTQSGESTRPLIVTSAFLAIAILIAAGVVASLVWMMGTRAESRSLSEVDGELEPPPAAKVVTPTVEPAPLPVIETEPAVVPEPAEQPTEEPAAVATAPEREPEPEPAVEKPAPTPSKPAAREEKAPEKQAEPPASEEPDEQAVEPPQPLEVVPPPQPEPAPVAQPEPEPKPAPVAAKEKEEEKEKEKADAEEPKKKKKKKKAPPLSF